MSARSAARSGPGTPATIALTRLGVSYTAHTYDHDPAVTAYGLEAAEALRVDPGRVFKTLLVDVDTGLAVGIVPVARLLDLKAFAVALGSKRAALADARSAERSTGYVVGGISPIGQKRPLPTVLDSTALTAATVFVSGGRRGFDIELSPADLTAATRALICSIARG